MSVRAEFSTSRSFSPGWLLVKRTSGHGFADWDVQIMEEPPTKAQKQASREDYVHWLAMIASGQEITRSRFHQATEWDAAGRP